MLPGKSIWSNPWAGDRSGLSENEALDRFSNKGLIPPRGQTVAKGHAMFQLVDPGTAPGEPGDVPKPGLSMTLMLDSASLGLAEALGWTDGRVPGAEVILQRGAVITQRDTLRTDEAGSAGIENLVPGEYKAWASRVLTPAELAQAETAGWDVRVLGGSGKFPITGAPQQAILELSPDRPGSLVISEWYFTAIVPPAQTSLYYFPGYVEIYNNSDSTIFLDGKIFGAGWSISKDLTGRPCSDDRLRNDPLGIFARFMHAFPGSGTEHPLAPGAAVVVATDGIDHTALVEGTIDLSGADFEFFGNADVDNPAVPNMIDVGLEPWLLGHGLFFLPLGGGAEVPFIAEPVDIAGLPVLFDPSSVATPRAFVRYPADKILDVATFRDRLNTEALGLVECLRMVNVRFDRVEDSERTDRPYCSGPARAPPISWWARSIRASHR